jgi:hypothetical protein
MQYRLFPEKLPISLFLPYAATLTYVNKML